MQVRVRASYEALYDQAGIMVRVDERNWLKAGIEKSDGQCQLSSVLTVDGSGLGDRNLLRRPIRLLDARNGERWRHPGPAIRRWETMAACSSGSISEGGLLFCRADVLHARTRRSGSGVFRILHWAAKR